jgi:hypothetical protein
LSILPPEPPSWRNVAAGHATLTIGPLPEDTNCPK